MSLTGVNAFGLDGEFAAREAEKFDLAQSKPAKQAHPATVTKQQA
ncbi:hypothetical protein [Faunimonas sp. B44]